MKHLVIVADGMADHPVERLGGKTLLQFADVPNMDALACNGRTGRLVTIPDGFSPGSDVANSVILGYDQEKVYEGRGPLEAASIGYEMRPGDLALRVSLISVDERGRIVNHHEDMLLHKSPSGLLTVSMQNLLTTDYISMRVRNTGICL